ncbi:uncharacterized protein TNCV_3104431 [Trichonephila clavipes]|nr:uncharacterized protein TNCV_3104431 [Trichonephila clavipes]
MWGPPQSPFLLPHHGGEGGLGEVRPEFCIPGRVTQGVKAIPLTQLKHKGNGQSQSSSLGLHGLAPTEAAHISSTMNHSPMVLWSASSVAQDKKKRRVRGLGRGPPAIDKLQSPLKRKLKIIQCNVNGLCSRAMQVKLDQLRELAYSHGAQIIALHETKLRPDSQLKMRGFDVFRTD